MILPPASRSALKRAKRHVKNVKVESTRPPLLTVYILQDDGRFMAKCPELDLVTEMDSREEVLDAIVQMIEEYAGDYHSRMKKFSRSPNRAHHKPYVEMIIACKTKWELLELLNVKYGHVYVQSGA
jgi:predicted RNase H-like HicB family nuclease